MTVVYRNDYWTHKDDDERSLVIIRPESETGGAGYVDIQLVADQAGKQAPVPDVSAMRLSELLADWKPVPGSTGAHRLAELYTTRGEVGL